MQSTFFQTIEVITGYLLISRNYLPYISLENLRVIRGQTLFDEVYAIYVFSNKNPNDKKQKLKELRYFRLCYFFYVAKEKDKASTSDDPFEISYLDPYYL